ncbi:MAG: glycine cleavage system aminomethyltransferase GcvT [Alphaproteobacteria bacterium]|nr:glycine cleavage system aminomethyltransferase GcvT [Rhodospirillaceae bacterium]MBT6204855.1 glycine cleavage system aminomethyltransferase GcvT [Rhodospirillaceae bacterium]MBT6509563.1 glycine cleavage system aminomethyltransferase GcvT [Rhodospirillaceae bacterium]MBT7647734.1 glycine cleavage system aminomethyltransferase GcvT [Rhodospirillaceae bacterium]MDG2480213.1 glycine cleavage system aminomethyltransferase GcvT [Alphaproteobacteria bacterium]
MSADADLLTTPLNDLHRELGARMVPFAGYAMPVQYPAGILEEHKHARTQAGLFDVSHMGQVRITAKGGAPLDDAAAALERLVPADMRNLKPGRQRYTQFTNAGGGILDDLMVNCMGDHLYMVVNAGTKGDDIALLQAGIGDTCEIEVLESRALVALQGPKAVAVLARLIPEVAQLSFMQAATWTLDGERLLISRSGYTGEDGCEISVPGHAAEAFVRRLLGEDEVAPVGLGARDSLRLEAGLCLYGHDIDTTTTPVEAGLTWSIQKRRREEGGFPGADIIQRQITEGPPRRRVGLKPEGGAPVREGAAIREPGGEAIGVVTSGGFGATVGGPVAMGYVRNDLAAPGTALELDLRGKGVAAEVVAMPFVPPGFHRK